MELLHFDKGIFILVAFVLLTLPLNWFLGWTMAVLIHEGCHLAMIRILQGKILGIRIGLWGMEIEMVPMPPQKELLCALAGPAGSLLLLCFLRVFPAMAVCAGAQALFNLLPIYPLDGGRVLRCILSRKFSEGERMAFRIEMAAICLVVAVFFLLRMYLLAVILGGMLIMKKISLQTRATRGTIVLHHEIAKYR